MPCTFYAVFTRKDSDPVKISGVVGVRLKREDAQLLSAATCVMPGYHVTIDACTVQVGTSMALDEHALVQLFSAVQSQSVPFDDESSKF